MRWKPPIASATNHQLPALASGEAAFQQLLTATAQAWNEQSVVLANAGSTTTATGNGLIVAGAGSETITDSTKPSTYIILPGANVTISNFLAGAGGSCLDFLSAGGAATLTTVSNGIKITVGTSSVTLVNVAPSALSLIDNLTGVGSLNTAGLTNQATLSAPTAVADFGSSQIRNITGVTAANASAIAGQVFNVAVTDSAANVAANIDSLQTLLTGGQLTSVALTDGGTPTLTITAAQAVNDQGVLGSLGSYNIAIADTAADIVNNLPTLETLATAGKLTSVTINDGGTIALNAGQATGDVDALLHLTPQSNLTISDTYNNASLITANLNAILELVSANKLTSLTRTFSDNTFMTTYFYPSTSPYSRIDYDYNVAGQLTFALQYNNDKSWVFTLGSVSATLPAGYTVKNTFIINNALASGTVITGGDTTQNILQVNGADISQATITGIQTLEVNGSVTLTAAELSAFTSLVGDAPSNAIKASGNGTYSLANVTSGLFNLDATGTTGAVTLIGGNQSGETLTAGTGVDTITTGTGAGDIVNGVAGDTVNVGGNGQTGTADTVNMSGTSTVTSTVSVLGGSNVQITGSYDSVWAYNHGANINVTVNGSNDSVSLNAGSTLTFTNGTGNSAYLSGDNVYINNTGETLTLWGSGDNITANSDTIYLGGGSLNDIISGSNDSVWAYQGGQNITVTIDGTNDQVGLNAGSSVTEGTASNDTVYMSNDTVIVKDAGSTLTLWGSNDAISVTSSTIYFGSGGLTNTITGDGNGVWASNGGTNISAIISGSNEQVGLKANSSVTFENGTNYKATLSNDSVILQLTNTNATLTVNGSGNTISGSSANITLAAGDQNNIISGSNDAITASSQTFYLSGGSQSDVVNGSGSVNVWASNGGQNINVTVNESSSVVGLNANSSATFNGTGETAHLSNDTVNLLTNSSASISGSGNTINTSAGDTVAINNGGSANLLEAAASGNDSFVNNGGAESYQFGATFGQDTINNGSGSTAQGEVDFLSGITESNLWFKQSGNDLLVDQLGTTNQIDIANWFGSNNAGAQVTGFHTSADGYNLDKQVALLVQAMATYSSANSGFNPTTATTMPNDPALQSTLATAWHA